MSCIFCDIVSGKSPGHKIWEDEKYIAILSIYPNTEGFSVVLPKKHYPSYAFDLDDITLGELVIASKKVARLIDQAFNDVGRTGMIFEGFGVNHVHSKLFPMHGTGGKTEWSEVKSNVDKFFLNYEGYISSHDHVRESDDRLKEVARKISGH